MMGTFEIERRGRQKTRKQGGIPKLQFFISGSVRTTERQIHSKPDIKRHRLTQF
jgi:hypothetical protein